jgi:hypothetical protein
MTQPFYVMTGRGVYVGLHPSPWTPPDILALIEAGKVTWGPLTIPPEEYEAHGFVGHESEAGEAKTDGA